MNWRKIEENNLFIEKGRRVLLGAGEYRIRSIKGIVWITWPCSDDIILNDGEEIFIRVRGMLCMSGFTGVEIYIKSKRIFPQIRKIPELLLNLIFKTLLSYIKNGEHQPFFGDSIHSITR